MRRVVFLRDFLLGYLAANGGEARVEDIEAAVRRVREKRNVIIAGGGRGVREEIEVLAAAGLLEERGGVVRLRGERLGGLLLRRLERLAAIAGW
ncbi:hypothetical protein Pyrfu_0356 [Pyrolobus fumarii 1A]|uniref:Uncharacterized protein n=1 Tax=Pyrolobus fumarii (strain DSM 11204 / 1A) TaxID=694429 RepID=G0EFQ7_PYRF1|nr:hypothetical protein [Pyrolobus fumarii]AEM38228.1 hypothetical protein Pyrfu_0356 [Pyrolobus fumarii 1A]